MEKIPHLYRKLLDVLRERTSQKYVRRKTLHADAARGYRITRYDVDIAMRELGRLKVVRRGQRGALIE